MQCTSSELSPPCYICYQTAASCKDVPCLHFYLQTQGILFHLVNFCYRCMMSSNRILASVTVMLILNGMTAGSVNQPATLNEIYLLANEWMKTTRPTQSGLACRFVTKLAISDILEDLVRIKIGNGLKRKTRKNQRNQSQKESKVKCFNCGKKGHIATSCPDAETAEEEAQGKKSFVFWEDEAISHVTYQVLNTVCPQQRFKLYDIVLGNQEDVSVVYLDLL